MKANNTIIYPKIQAIEPTPKSKKSGVLIGIGFVLFISGMALYGFGIVYKFSLAFGLVSAILGFLTVAAGNKLAPSCDFPKKEHRGVYSGSNILSDSQSRDLSNINSPYIHNN